MTDNANETPVPAGPWDIVDRLRRTGAYLNDGHHEDTLTDAADEIERLRAALNDALEYARHDDGCNGLYGSNFRCRCRWRTEEPRLRAVLPCTETPS